MKIKTKFILFFSIGLFLFLLLMSLIMIPSFEYLFPLVSLNPDEDAFYFLLVFATTFIIGGYFFSYFFTSPLVILISMIKNASVGDYKLNAFSKKLYNKKDKLKRKFFLYNDLLDDMENLFIKLEKNEIDRKELEIEKTNWLHGVSHDIKTPLSYIKGYSEILLDNNYKWNDDEAIKFLSIINNKSDEIEVLVSNMNEVFREYSEDTIVSLQKSQFDIATFIKSLIINITNHPKANNYTFELENNLLEKVKYTGDEQLLIRAFQNVYLNAIEHNKENTCITTYIDKYNGYLNISICDDGEKIPLDIITNIFDTRVKSDDKSDGQGLGLFITNKIITKHKGIISVDNKDNGVCFKVSLPI